MIIVDFSAILYQNIFSACKHSTDMNGKPIKKYNGKYKTEEFKRMFLHKLVNSLRYIYKDNKERYGTMVLAIDNHTASNWRKDIYPEYKAGRKDARSESDVNFPEVFAIIDEVMILIKEAFPFIVVDVEKAEGDDVVGVLANTYAPIEEVLVVTHDKDMLQLLKHKSVTIYNPIKMKRVPKMSKQELIEWEVKHVFMGDVADNIPKVPYCTEYSKKFISFLQSNDIYENRVYEFQQLSISDKLIQEFLMNNSADEIYKPTRFGEVAFGKFMEDYDTNMNSNPLYKEHYKRNEELILFDYIPTYLSKNIIECYQEQEVKIDIGKITSFMLKYQLMELYNSYQDFLLPTSSSKLKPKTSSNDDSEHSEHSEKLKDDVLISSLDEW